MIGIGVGLLGTGYAMTKRRLLRQFEYSGFRPALVFAPGASGTPVYYHGEIADFDGITGRSFERSTAGRFIDSAGDLQAAAVNEERASHYTAPSGVYAKAGLLVEKASANLLTYSSATTITWASPQATSLDQNDDFMGAHPGVEVISNGAVYHRLQHPNVSVASGVACTFSIWIKAGQGGMCRAVFRDVNSGSETAVAGAIGAQAIVKSDAGAVSIRHERDIPGGHICQVTFTPNFTGGMSFGVGPNSAVSGDRVTVYAAQLETGSVGTSLIPTDGASGVRGADDVRIPARIMAKAMADYANNAELWAGNPTIGDGWTDISGGRYSCDGSQPGVADLLAFILVAGGKYSIEYTVTNYVSGSIRATASANESPLRSGNGTFLELLNTTNNAFRIRGSSDFVGDVSKITVRRVSMPDAVSIVAKLRANYADIDDGNTAYGINWTAGSEYIRQRISTLGANTGFVIAEQVEAGSPYSNSSAAAYSPGAEVVSYVASRHGPGFVQMANDGNLAAVGTAVTTLPDLVMHDMQIASVGTWIVEEVFVFFDDIGSAGILEAVA